MLAGTLIDRVDKTKFLGFIIDEKLNWKEHVSTVSLKVSRNIGVMNRVKFLLPKPILKLQYYTLVYPHLIYCVIVWGRASASALRKLICVQKEQFV